MVDENQMMKSLVVGCLTYLLVQVKVIGQGDIYQLVAVLPEHERQDFEVDDDNVVVAVAAVVAVVAAVVVAVAVVFYVGCKSNFFPQTIVPNSDDSPPVVVAAAVVAVVVAAVDIVERGHIAVERDHIAAVAVGFVFQCSLFDHIYDVMWGRIRSNHRSVEESMTNKA